MIAIEDGDRRIAMMERELARLQAEHTTPNQIAANLVRDALKQTIDTAAVLAGAALVVIREVGDELDESVPVLANDLIEGSDGNERGYNGR